MAATTSPPYPLPQWPEWNDNDIINEKWDSDVLPPTSATKGKGPATVSTPQQPASEKKFFEDPSGKVKLPSVLMVAQWKRFSEFMNNIQVYAEPPEGLDFVAVNKHLLHSDLVAEVISSITNLYHIANMDPFPVEGEGPNFVPNAGPIWRPWHHVYSMCKAGKGQPHKPLINPYGKYVVRLFHMGCWRKIYVDDSVPFSEQDICLLPLTPDKNQVWPLLITKAVLKIAALTSSEAKLVDCSVTSCLTGWLCQEVDFKQVPNEKLWPVFTSHLPNYKWPPLPEEVVADGSKKEEKKVEKGKGKKDDKKAEKGKKETKGKGAEAAGKASQGTTPPPITHYCVVIGVFAEMEEENCPLPEYGPCCSHRFFVLQSRDISLERPPSRPNTPQWKRYRWKSWAARKGIIPAPEEVPIRSLRIYSAMKKVCYEEPTPPPETEKAPEEVSNDVLAIPSKDKGEKGNGDAKGKGGKAAKGKKEEKDVSKGKKEEKDLSKGQEKKGEEVVVKPDIMELTTWVPLQQLCSAVKRFIIFHKTSAYPYIYRITDAGSTAEPKSAAKDKKNPKDMPGNFQLSIPVKLAQSRNDGIYLFTESPEKKNIVMSLAVVPFLKIKNPASVSALPTDTAVSVTQGNVTDVETGGEASEEGVVTAPTPQLFSASLVVEDFTWKSAEIGRPFKLLKTVGRFAVLLQLDEGRTVLRIWARVQSAYVIQMVSTSPFVVGNRDKILEYMGDESERLVACGDAIVVNLPILTEAFGKLTFASALQQFCLAYKIPVQTAEQKLIQKGNHERFQKALYDFLKAKLTGEQLKILPRLLRTLFMNPKIGMTEKHPVFSRYAAERTEKEIIEEFDETLHMHSKEFANQYSWTENIKTIPEDHSINKEEYVVCLQSHIRRYQVMRMRKKHSPLSPEYTKLYDNLQKMAAVVTTLSKKERVGVDIMRKMFVSNPPITKYFPLGRDLNYCFSLLELKGAYNVMPASEWALLFRVTLNCHSVTAVPCAIDVFCSLIYYVVHVMDNDTGLELPKTATGVQPYEYTPNEDGYTVFAYGYTEGTKTKDNQWRLRVMTEPGYGVIHACTKANNTCSPINKVPQPYIDELTGYYIPSKDNMIERWLIKVYGRALVSFRFKVSYEPVEFELRLKSESGSLLKSLTAQTTAIIPVVVLGSGMPETLYILEAEVLRNTWPLTFAEWKFVKSLVDKRSAELLVFSEERVPSATTPQSASSRSTTMSTTSLKRQKSTSQILIHENPHWLLQTVLDSAKTATVTVDKRKEESYKQLKLSWEENDPGRNERGKQLREMYLSSQPIQGELESKRDTTVDSLEGEPIIESEVRFTEFPNVLFAPPNLDRDFSAFIQEVEEEQVVLADIKEDDDQMKIALEASFQESEKNFFDKHAEILATQRENHKKVSQILSQAHHNSVIEMEASYAERDGYVRRKLKEIELAKQKELEGQSKKDEKAGKGTGKSEKGGTKGKKK